MSARAAFRGLDACVHCGFCLPACPTYEATADENDSPRGRIVLMRALERGALPPSDDQLADHLDRCLGCRACESVCPSGVVFGPALEAARAELAVARGVGLPVRAFIWLLATPPRQRWLWAAARLLRGTGIPAWLARSAGARAPALARAMAMLAATRPLPSLRPARAAARPAAALPATDAATPSPPRAATLFSGCVMDGLFGHVHDAARAALRANGFTLDDVPGQVCCGALAAHAGLADVARDLARRNVRAFDAAAPDAAIVVDSAGCGAMLKAYGEWLAGDPLEARARALAARVADVSEALAEAGPRPGTRAVPLRLAYDAPCHLLHAQRVAAAPLAVLRAVPGLELVPLDGSERCCGGAGIYTLVQPDLSGEVLARKLAAVRDAAPDAVATGNPGCQMQIGAGLVLGGAATAVCHPVELLAASYRP